MYDSQNIGNRKLYRKEAQNLYFDILCLDFLTNSKCLRIYEGFGVCDGPEMADSKLSAAGRTLRLFYSYNGNNAV